MIPSEHYEIYKQIHFKGIFIMFMIITTDLQMLHIGINEILYECEDDILEIRHLMHGDGWQRNQFLMVQTEPLA